MLKTVRTIVVAAAATLMSGTALTSALAADVAVRACRKFRWLTAC